MYLAVCHLFRSIRRDVPLFTGVSSPRLLKLRRSFFTDAFTSAGWPMMRYMQPLQLRHHFRPDRLTLAQSLQL